MKRPPHPPAAPRYIDRPEVDEVFADRLEHLFFDGGQVRMEFTVTRTEADPAAAAAGAPIAEPKRWAYTACRVVLSARGAAEMLNKMNELRMVLQQQGVITMVEAPPPPPTGGAARADTTQPTPQPEPEPEA